MRMFPHWLVSISIWQRHRGFFKRPRSELEVSEYDSGAVIFSIARYRFLAFPLRAFQIRCQLFFADPNTWAAVMPEFPVLNERVSCTRGAIQPLRDIRDAQ